ncbi:HEAT repeat-containing protein 3 [Collichthys lucidus]|uniref:HEAT repeat-containing protein 3 n=1 Tax=Collichthys lucidus TaxID=240159 RepID=A0A4V6AMT4_COLLU|nr:HEAT repeat-containing protein 3 [Collichthys lucidus]
MGKSKTTKFKRSPFNSVGLPVNAVKEEEGDEEHDEDGCPAAELLEKLQSPSADVREFACASISRVVQQSQTISGFLQRDAVRRLGPMLLDSSLAVRETATGALRNLSACGGQEVCEDMVKHDVMTPLTALLRECCAGFESAAEPMKEQKNAVEDVANEAVNLLWNLCESSSQALSMFNKAGLLDVVIPCLERHPQNVELAISAAHCLHTVTEDNAELLCSLNAAVLGVLENVLLSSQPSMTHTLLRTLAAGTLWNMKASLPAAHQAQTLNAVVATLSRCLDLDTGTLIPELRQAEVIRHRNTPAASDAEEQAPVVVEEMNEEEEEEEGPKHKKNGKAVRADNDFSDLLPRGMEELREATALLTAQQTSLEIIVNMCCSDDPSDDEWEEESSSDESDMGPDALCDGVSNLMSPLCLSAEVHGALISHSIPEKANTFLLQQYTSRRHQAEAMDVCHQNASWRSLTKKMQRVQSRALTCLHSILSTMDAESLGGPAALQGAAQHLSTLVFGAGEIPKDEEFLEAWVSKVRALLKPFRSINMSYCKFQSLSNILIHKYLSAVDVHASAYLAQAGSVSGKTDGTLVDIKVIGVIGLHAAHLDCRLGVLCERLQALLRAFGSGEESYSATSQLWLLFAEGSIQMICYTRRRSEWLKGLFFCLLKSVCSQLQSIIFGKWETLPLLYSL